MMSGMLPATTHLLRLSLAAYFLVGIAGCGRALQSKEQLPRAGGQVNLTQIEQVQHPQQTNTIVYLKGKAGQQAPFLGSSAYELQDATGTLWIVTKAMVPAKGTEVLIKGKVLYKSIPLAGQEAGEFYVEELERY